VKSKEALDILTQTTGQLQATRQVHEAIVEALRTLAEATVGDKPVGAPKRGDTTPVNGERL